MGRVALLARDTADSVIAIHAVRLAGKTLVPLHRRLTLAELAPMVRRAGVTRLVHDAGHGRLAQDVARAIPGLDVDSICPSSPCYRQRYPGRSTDLGAIGACMFTSGTSGEPRAALLTHANLLASADAWNSFLDAGSTDHWLAALPLSHVAGLGVVLRSTRSGARLTVHDRFDPTAIRRALAEAGVTFVSLVPTQLHRLLDEGPVVAPGLRALLLGGAPIPVALVRRAVEAGLPVVPTYGLTEAASGVTASPADEALVNPGQADRPCRACSSGSWTRTAGTCRRGTWAT